MSAQAEVFYNSYYQSLAHTRRLEALAGRPGVAARREVSAERWPEGYDNLCHLNRVLEARLASNDLPRLSVRGLRYVAHGVRPYPCPSAGAALDWSLLAVAIGHDDDGHLSLDDILRDTTVAAVLPTLRTYGLRWLTDVSVDEVGYPLGQAWGYVCQELFESRASPSCGVLQ
jgi:hypothetical protein